MKDGQRFINLTLASAAELCEVQNRGTGTGTLVAPTIESMALYINNIFVNPEIHKIFRLVEIKSGCKTTASIIYQW